ncbi:MAG: RagB/SusD family nutrient uptake outer membrane protein, partial [Bacteroidales bacterium]|nr:RagB/SusD family nutrient uptake outer membrane protein [Bacteroidales bacterium]
MKKISKYLIVLMVGLTVISCEDFLQPLDDKPVTDQMMIADPAFMEGLLLHAYKALPNKYAYDIEAATDNAVTNVKTLNYLIINSGAWSSEYTPFNTFDNYFEEIYYINKFLANYKKVNWSDDPRILPAENLAIADGHKKRLKGEAYGLRAWYEYQLLQTTSGIGSDNSLLGFPIVTAVESMSDEYKLPRNTFEECVQQILNDCDTALTALPMKYVDIAGNTVHNRTMGVRFLDRLDARGVLCIKAQTLLLAASPAFNPTNDLTKWEAAAVAAAQLINDVNAVLPSAGRTFYKLASATAYNNDVIWANSRTNRNDFEQENYPPSLNGDGRINPTQNLVDAFPMATGYPIGMEPAYDPLNPYAGRDLRFYEYILADGQTLINPIDTYVESGMDGLNNLLTSTRTGYYMKKFMDVAAKYNPATNSWSNSARAYINFRYTQMFLNFAEAANEAWGPTGATGFSYTAQDILAKIRTRAGIPAADPYLLTDIGSDQALFRELVRNERRLELCFEGSRFWDIRRWNLVETMKETAEGMRITFDGTTKTYSVIDVEERNYSDHMIFPPVPYEAVIKSSLVQ